MDTESSAKSPIDLMVEEFLDRRKKGEKPAVDEFCRRCPEMAEEIRDVFEALMMVEDLKPDSQDKNETGHGGFCISGPRPEQIGGYRILREIGRGGMGVVYEAEQLSLGRRVALKVLPQDITATPERLARFEREARAAARMHHTNIVPVFDVGHEENTAYYAMQLINGQGLDLVIRDLRHLRQRNSGPPSDSPARRAESMRKEPDLLAHSLLTGRFKTENLASSSNGAADGVGSPELSLTSTVAQEPMSRSSAVLPGQSDIATADTNRHAYFQSVAEIGMQTARALSYAHARGIIHRDIKPSNLLLDTAGVIWVTDFGLAKTGDEALTHTGDILGTLRYMSPERFRGQCDQRADVYSLGMTLYELLVLRSAFVSSDRVKTIEQIRNTEPPAPRSLDPSVPVDLETIVLKSIDKDPKRRYPTADDLAEDLHRFAHDQPIKARPVSSIERVVRWSRRNKSVAASSLVVATLLIVLAIGSMLAAGYFHRQQAIQRRLAAEKATEAQRAFEARSQAIKAQDEAEVAQRDAEGAAERNRRLLYATNMQLADQLWKSPDGTARELEELLVAWIPVDEKDDLREFTWRHQWSRLQDAAAITVFDATAATVSPAGNLIAADGKGIREWDRSGQVTAHPWKGDAAVAISGDGRWAAVRGSESQLQFIEIASGEIVRVIDGTKAAFSINGRFVAVWDDGISIQVSTVDSGDAVAAFELADGSFSPDASEVALAPDGKAILVRRQPKRNLVSLYEQGKVDPQLLSHLGMVRVCAWSPDGRVFACGDGPGRVYIRLTERPRFSEHFVPGGWSVDSVAFSPDSRQLAVGKLDGNVDIWDVSDVFDRLGSDSATVPGVTKLFSGRSLANSTSRYADADKAAVASEESPTLRRTLKGHTERVASARFSQDGQSLATVDIAGVAKLWALNGMEDSDSVFQQNDELRDIGIDVDAIEKGFEVSGMAESLATEGTIHIGDRVLTIQEADGAETSVANMSLMELQSRMIGPAGSMARLKVIHGGVEKVVDLHRTVQSDTRLWSVAFSPDGQSLAAAGLGGTFLWDLKSGEPARRLPGQGQAVAFSSDGRYLAFSDIESVHIWDRQSRETHATWSIGDQTSCFAFSPGGEYLAAGMGHSTFHEEQRVSPVKVWSIDQQQEIATRLDPFDNYVTDMQFSPDGRLLIATDFSGRIRFWDTKSWTERMRIRDDGAWSLAISPDGKQLAVGGGYDARGITLWNIESGAKTHVLGGHVQPVCDLAYSPDGRTLASVSADRTIVLWDTSTNMPLRTLRGHTGWIPGADFSSDGERLATASFDGTVRVWHAARTEQIERDPRTIHALLRLGTFLNEQKRFVQAEKTLARTLRLQETVLPRYALEIAQARAQLGQAYLGQGKNEQAIEVLTEGLAEHPDDATLLQTRARAYLWLIEYDRAAQDYLRRASHQLGCFHAAVLFLMADDMEGYRQACDLIVRRFAAPGRVQHEQIIKTLLLSPRFIEGDTFPYQVDVPDRYDGSSRSAWHQWQAIAGLLRAYRVEDFEDAQSWIEYINTLQADDLVIDKALANVLVLKSMIAFRLGQVEEAKQRLSEAGKLIDRLMVYPPEGPDIVLLRDIFQAEVLRREAHAMIYGEPPSNAAAGR